VNRLVAAVVAVVCRATLASAQVADPPVAAPGMQPAQPLPAGAQLPSHHGFTAELNLGIGLVYALDLDGVASNAALAGPDLGLGGWISPRTALTFRIAGVFVSQSGTSAQTMHQFVGPSMQYWFDRHLWVGGGVGLAVYHQVNDGCALAQLSTTCAVTGFGLDARVGYSWVFRDAHAIDVAVEINPGVFSQAGDTALLTGLALLVGYQYL